MSFENNVKSTLNAAVAVGATSIQVVKAVAPNKDFPASGRLTLSKAAIGSNPAATEIITYTGRTDNTTYWTLTGVTKNTESSFGDQAWASGDSCFQAITAADAVSFFSTVNGVENSVEHTATAGQTSFAVTYDVGHIELYINGVRLDASDYTATNGTSVVLDTGATAGDTVFIQAFGTFTLADHYTKAQTLSLIRFEIDGGVSNSVYLTAQSVNGGSANG
jgi:hypothetical protein